MFPQLNMLGINEKLREHWHSLSRDEKAAFKDNVDCSETPLVARTGSASITSELATIPQLSSSSSPETTTTASESTTTVSSSNSSSISANTTTTISSLNASAPTESINADASQSIIHKCPVCGRMFLGADVLANHIETNHQQPEETNVSSIALLIFNDLIFFN